MNRKYGFLFLAIFLPIFQAVVVVAQDENPDFTVKIFRLDETQYPAVKESSPVSEPSKSMVTFFTSGCSVTDVAVVRVTTNVDGIAFSEPFEHEIAKASARLGANAYYMDPTTIVNKNTQRILEESGKAIRYSCDGDPLPSFVIYVAAANPKEGPKQLKQWRRATAGTKAASTVYGKSISNLGDQADNLIFSECFDVDASSVSESASVLLLAYNGPKGELFRKWLGFSSSTSSVASLEELKRQQTLSNVEIQNQFRAAEVPIIAYLKQALALQAGEEDYSAYANYAAIAEMPNQIIPYSQYSSTPYNKSNICAGIRPFVREKKRSRTEINTSKTKPHATVESKKK